MGKVATSTLPSWGSPTLSMGTKITNRHLTRAISSPHVGNVATSPLPSWGSSPISARTKVTNGYPTFGGSKAHMWPRCYITPPVSGPQHSAYGEKSQKATSPLPSRLGGGGNTTQGNKNHKSPPHPCHLRGSHVGKLATSPLPSRRSPTLSMDDDKWLPHLWCLKGPHVGTVATSPLPSRGPQRSGRGGKSQKLPRMYRLRGPCVDKMATPPLPSWGSPTLSTGTQNTNGTNPAYKTSAFASSHSGEIENGSITRMCLREHVYRSLFSAQRSTQCILHACMKI